MALEGRFRIDAPTTATADAAVVPVGVPRDLRYLDGHFPGNPIVPGVAQLILVEGAARRAFPDLGATQGIGRLKFRARIDPGDEVEVALERRTADVRFTIRRGETECTKGVLLVAPKDE
ncbi:MAG: hypothetical protein AAGH15_01745 [Myxococcota bacterium]